jgi:CheY-like chemotaxis protein
VIVEDEWLIRMELADALGAAGWAVLEASSGEVAVTLLSAHIHPDILVTDIRLGGATTGWDVADAFRARHPAIPVIYASGNAPLPSRQLAASRFLAKPVNIRELVGLANEARANGF